MVVPVAFPFRLFLAPYTYDSRLSVYRSGDDDDDLGTCEYLDVQYRKRGWTQEQEDFLYLKLQGNVNRKCVEGTDYIIVESIC